MTERKEQEEIEYQKSVGEIPKNETEWDELMENAELKIRETQTPNGGTRIEGKIKNHEIVLYYLEAFKAGYSGELDGKRIDSSTAERLFKKYLPIALAQNQDQIKEHVKAYKEEVEEEKEETEKIAKTL